MNGSRRTMRRHQGIGVIGMIGGAAYATAGIRLLGGAGQDGLTNVLGLLWGACWAVAASGMFTRRVTGPSRIARVFSAVLVAGFTCATLWAAHRLVDQAAADRGPFAIAPLIVIVGMLGTAMLVVSERTWSGWRRFVPLAIALVYVATVATSIATGRDTVAYAFTLAGIGFVVLGDTLRREHDAGAPP
jgi:hypothetical protein